MNVKNCIICKSSHNLSGDLCRNCANGLGHSWNRLDLFMSLRHFLIDVKSNHNKMRNLKYEELTSEDKRKLKKDKDCAVCGKHENLQVHHCHLTGEVHGILCGRCNRTSGFFKDRLDIVEKMLNYLLLTGKYRN